MLSLTYKYIYECGPVCEKWRKKAPELYKEFIEATGRTEFGFEDIVTNSSINDDEFDTLMNRIFTAKGVGAYCFEIWLFGFYVVDEDFEYEITMRVFREIFYTLIHHGLLDQLFEEFIKCTLSDLCASPM